jgi:hypothetical protein
MNLSILKILFISVLAHSISFSQTKREIFTTEFEKSDFLRTSNYQTTLDYFNLIASETPYVQLFDFGQSPEGRTLTSVVVSKDKNFHPAPLINRKKPLIFIINGIHSGEIEGKEASMLLLREMLITGEKEDYLDYADLLIIPVFNVDGHERFSPYNRINQVGPEEMGWRTTSHNLNLNRDWMKADAPEMQALLQLFSTWNPDFFIDNHTTNGADYQYTVTYAIEKEGNMYPPLSLWVKNRYLPYMESFMNESNYLIFPYVNFRDWQTGLESGIIEGTFSPRFSNGYSAARNTPGLLIETHMLKSFKERVFSTKKMIESVIHLLKEDNKKLLDLRREAAENWTETYGKGDRWFPINLKLTDNFKEINFKGVEAIYDSSVISGGVRKTYTGKPVDITVKFYNEVIVTDSVKAPAAYIIPREWSVIAERLKLHGIIVEELSSPFSGTVTRYKFDSVTFAKTPYEGRQRVNFSSETYTENYTAPAGSYIVKCPQPEIGLILHLLEPKGDDSFVRWGFFNSIFEPKEYFENYVMEKLAPDLLASDPQLLKDFEERLNKDEEFRKSPGARLKFIYERSPYFDKRLNVYPVVRIE